MNLSLVNNKVTLDENSNDELLSAILISIFTDDRATEEEFSKVEGLSKKGYWGSQLDGIKVGSKLWLLERAPRNDETLERAEDYVTQALFWMKDKGITEEIEVEAFWKGEDMRLDLKLDNKSYVVNYAG